MNESEVHPVDRLGALDKSRIYFSRIVDLAVVSGLLVPDPNTAIGHFAFSRHYFHGKQIDRDLQKTLREFRDRYPDLVAGRRAEQDRIFSGAVENFSTETDTEKVHDLIIIGATHSVWPVGTSFALTYPWDLNGTGLPVRFRTDLSDFMKRRVLEILQKAGKLRNPDIFLT
ncbi:MAG: hypothetical protein HY912_14975 [Desulfomonile tiedjei]|uniref:Uncharacterized protein n=1 Tax=Desulfomonile tiedjei TaxID=2358 RepID=A0A9D6V871_9BACT|nr:hypothetical protein [Desulfomonile tiedjei]